MKDIRIMALITEMANSDNKLYRLFIADRIFDLMGECKHIKTTRVSPEGPKIYECDNCQKQFDESEVCDVEDRNDDSSKDVGREYE